MRTRITLEIQKELPGPTKPCRATSGQHERRDIAITMTPQTPRIGFDSRPDSVLGAPEDRNRLHMLASAALGQCPTVPVPDKNGYHPGDSLNPRPDCSHASGCLGKARSSVGRHTRGLRYSGLQCHNSDDRDETPSQSRPAMSVPRQYQQRSPQQRALPALGTACDPIVV